MDKKLYIGIVKLILFMGLILLSILKIDIIAVMFSKLVSVMFPVFFGIGLAFVLKSISKKIYMFFVKFIYSNLFKNKRNLIDEKNKLNNIFVTISILFTYLLFFGLIIALIYIIIPEISNSVSVLYQNLEVYFRNIDSIVGDLQEKTKFLNIDMTNITENVKNLPLVIGNYIRVVVPNIFGATIGVMGSVVSIILGVILSLYIVFDANNIKKLFVEIVQTYFSNKRGNKIFKIARTADSVFSSFIIGQLTEAMILGLLCFIGMNILSIEYSSLVSTLVGTFSLVPLVGTFVGAAISVLLLLGVSPSKALLFIVFFIILQQFEGNVIYPKVVGDSLGLPAIWLLISIIVGGGMFGILGTLFSVPIVATIYRLLIEDIEIRKSKKINDC